MRSKLTTVIDGFFQSKDSIQIFLNAYSHCLANQDKAYNLLRNKRHQSAYESILRTLGDMLRGGVPVASLRKALDSNEDPGILVATMALSAALAKHIAIEHGTRLTSYSEPFRNSVGDQYWLAVEGDGPFGGRIPNPPRNIDQLHWTVRRFRKPLLVTPYHVGKLKLTRIAADREIENHFDERLRAGRFRIAVSSLSYEVEIKGESESVPGGEPPCEFHLTSIEPLEEQLSTLRNVLDRANREGASILVLPELRMPPPMFTATKEFLHGQVMDGERGLLLVTAGSWHVEIDGARYNRSVTLTCRGEELWTHDKLREYVITADNVRYSPEAFRDIGVGEDGASEAIHRGTTLEFYDSVIGRVAAAICVGFFSGEVATLLEESNANIFLVPAMTTSTSDLEARAKALIRSQRAATFVANCGHVGAKSFSFYQLPIKGSQPKRLTPNGGHVLFFDLSNI